MPYDEDLQNGLRNLQEILSRLDDRADNIKWVKEHAPADAPDRIKEAIVDNFPQPKAVPPPAEPPVQQPQAVEPPAPVEIPALIHTAPAETPLIIPEPAPQPPIMPAVPELPAFLAPVAAAKETLPPAPEPLPAVEPQPLPAVKPAKKPIAVSRSAVIMFCTGLAIAGAIAYQFTVNNAKARYARAGELVKAARNTEAISAYTRIISLYNGSPEAAYSQLAIGDIKAVLGDNAGAIERYEKYLLAAPAGDAKVPEAKFKIAEIEFKDANFTDADFMYNSPDIRTSGYAKQAADRISLIKAVNDLIAGARKLAPKNPAKAVETLTTVLAAYPGLKAAADGLEEAQKALAAANGRPAARHAARAAKPITARAPKPVRAKPAPAPGKAATATAKTGAYTKEQFNICNSVWMMEKIQGRLDAPTAAAGQENDCGALKENMTACKGMQEEYKAVQNLKPEARALIEQETNPDWTAAKQIEQDKKTLKAYQTHRCAEMIKTFTR